MHVAAREVSSLLAVSKLMPPASARSRAVLTTAACVIAWPLLTEVIRLATGADDFYGVPFALGAVVVAAWVGGGMAGLAVTAVSVLWLAGVLPEARVVDAKAESVWHLLVFSLVAVFVSGFVEKSRRLKERLENEIEYKNSFLSLMSHELRTPATVIYSGIRLLRLRGDKLSHQETLEVVDGIEVESERLAQLVDDLITFARIQSGHNGFHQLLPMTDLVQRSVEGFRHRHPKRVVQCVLPVEPCSVLGQERYVEMVLRHLLANSDAYSPPSEVIVVTLARDGVSVTTSVRDYGSGLQKDELHSVFQPYYRGRLPAGSRGLGLGLTLSKKVVEAMDGHIAATSPEGGGLEVSFTLPAS